MKHPLWIELLVLTFISVTTARADEPLKTTSTTEGTQEGEYQTTVVAKKPITAASETSVRERDLKLRPIRRPADLLAVVPGLFVVQHAGGGKANQYFLRGFDADHGTDVAFFVDGIPVNQVSHGHGQGYADLNWLIPETIEKVEVSKGTYYGFIGDFGTAGGIHLTSKKRIEENRATLSGGMFNTLRATSLGGADIAGFNTVFAVEGYYTDGPFIRAERTRRLNYFIKTTGDLSQKTELTLGTTGYIGEWNASGQIPEREVKAGRLDRFGFIDKFEGGDSRRHSLFGKLAYRPNEEDELKLMAYVVHSELSLFSDFTFFATDPVNGDMINQTDVRTYYGTDASYRWSMKLGDLPTQWTFGLQSRRDNIDNSLRNSPRRIFSRSVNENRIAETSLSGYFTSEITWVPWLRSNVSLRGDHFWFSRHDKLTNTDVPRKTAHQISPKASVVASASESVDLFMNFGLGFHSNDTRGVTAATDPATPLSKATGFEFGSRAKMMDKRLDLAASVFLLDLESELVFSGDSGSTEASGRSRRYGVEFEGRVQLLSWLYADLDLIFNRARFRGLADGSDYVPYAPARLFSGGVSVVHPAGYFGRFGFFHVADRPAREDYVFRTEGFLRFDVNGGYRWKNLEVAVTVQNLFNTQWREAQFNTESQLPGEGAPVEDIHFTPGAPLNAQTSVTYYF